MGVFFRTAVPFILQALAWPLARGLFVVFARFRVYGLEHLEGLPKGVIFASNHLGQLDPILIRAAIPYLGIHQPFFYVARTREYYKWQGWRKYVFTDLFFRAWGAYPAYKGTGRYDQSLVHHVYLAKKGKTICYFPGGQQKEPSESVSARGGIGYLASVSGLPVVPTYVRGSHDIRPMHFLRRKYSMSVTFGEPIFVQERYPGAHNDVEQCKGVAQEIVSQIHTLR